MAIKHQTIQAYRPESLGTPSKTYISGAAIVDGAPLVFSSGKVVEASDNDAGAAGPIVGFAEHAVSAADLAIRVQPATPGKVFIGSLTTLTASVASDAGTKALAQTDVGTICELHKDDTTAKWVVGATGGANASAVIVGLIDPVGATTNDAITSVNSGKALVEFIIQTADSLYA